MVTLRAGPAASLAGVGLLERAIGYALGSLLLVTPEAMSRATPCCGWDLRALLAHMNDSMLALHEAAGIGRVHLGRLDAEPDPAVDPVAALRDRGCELLGAWTNSRGMRPVTVSGGALTGSIVSSTGALEITVHGWDVAHACGQHRPIPTALGEELLDLSRVLVTAADRPSRFGPAVPVLPSAPAGEQLLGFLGRTGC